MLQQQIAEAQRAQEAGTAKPEIVANLQGKLEQKERELDRVKEEQEEQEQEYSKYMAKMLGGPEKEVRARERGLGPPRRRGLTSFCGQGERDSDLLARHGAARRPAPGLQSRQALLPPPAQVRRRL